MTDKISVATYSLRDSIKQIGMEGMAAFLQELGVTNVEINNVFTRASKLQENVDTFKQHGITTVLLTYDGNNFFMPDEEDRGDQLEAMKPWLDAAKAAGIPMVRANMGHPFELPECQASMFDDLIATFTPIQEYAESLGLTFVFENHGGPSSDVDFQLRVKDRFPTGKMGFLLDTGNYTPKPLVYDNIRKLGSSIKIVHAKTYDFDENGEETQLDFKRIIAALKEIGFDGYYSVEYEGSRLPNKDGVRSTVALLRKYL